MKSLSLTTVLTLLVICASVYAASSESEKQKQLIRSYMSERVFSPVIAKDEAFCESFFDDFSMERNISYVEPVVVAHHFDDDSVQSFVASCPNLELRTPIVARSGPYVGPRTFKIYKVDLIDSTDDGNQFLFLESAFWVVRGRATNYEPSIQSRTIYRLVDRKRCTAMGSIYVGGRKKFAPDANLANEDPTTSYHGVIKYHGRYYVFDLIFQSGYGSPLSIFTFDEEKPSRFSPICKFME